MSKPVKILFVQPVMSPYTVPRYIELAKDGRWDVNVALETHEFPTRPGWVPREIDGVTVTVLDNWLRKKKVADGSYIDKAIPYGLISTIRKLRPEIVIVCNPTELILAIIARLFCRFRLGLLMEDTPHSQRHKQGLVAKLRRRLFRHVDFISCYSQDANDYIDTLDLSASIYRTSWTIDPAWLDNARPDYKDGTVSDKDRDVMRYLFVGAMIERKGVLPLLQAWQQAMSARDDVELVMLGEGPLMPDLQEYISNNAIENVNMLGSIPYDQVGDVYRSADVFVLATMEDLFSLVVTEAMAYGLPVLTTIYNGARELVVEGENGYIFDSRDVDNMAEVLTRISGDRHRLTEMGARSHQIIADYTHQKVMHRFSEDLANELTRR